MAATSDLPSIIGFRYVVEAPIGRGGMAVVARVLDRQSGDRLALKQLLARGNSSTASRARMLFERECQTLALLDHPRIVRVLDYGVDNDLPYYTMELLDGGDLIERAPLPWQQACMIGRDVCSALSLLHARRMVYRDLSPRNVRLTTDGTAKLIDFGAMAPMGSAEFVVCTPSVAAPEVVNLLPLDGRADLYALGAVLFQTLTGRTPYPASNFQRLAELWKVAIAPPSAYVDGIPEALDSLVMELLKLEAKQRPASAAEVSERLCAIAGLEQDDKLVDCSAYLTTPDLTARHDALRSIHERVLRLNLDRQGASLVLSGATGEGRSRMLDASVSFAKLEGTTVLRIGGDDGSGGYLEVIERLAKQLVNSLPNAPSCASEETWSVLVQLVPSLHGLAPDRPAESIAQADVQARALPALR
ncbi:MAG TPA: serine/threonine-protein kinase, partial [Polyangiales bacterium]